MGRPANPDNRGRTATAIRFRPDLHARLREAAVERDVPINYLVNRAVEEFLDALIPIDDVQFTYPRPTGPPVPLPPPGSVPPPPDRRPHSRACGWRHHEHGTACHSNCPTCGGKALP